MNMIFSHRASQQIKYSDLPEGVNLPPTWSRMGFTAKAGWLTARLGISYEQACSRLAKRALGRKHKPAAVTVPRQYRLPYID